MLPRPDRDWPDFLHFFADRFESLGLKKLIATEAGGPGGAGTAFLLCEDNSDNGHIGPDDLEFCRLRGGAGLRDEDVLQFRDEADVAVAAPPQGQGATFATWAREGGKAYLSLGTGNPCVLRQPGEEKRPGNSGLTDAKNAKNDEFYTREEDVASEMEAYIKRNKDVFCGKTILLPCDDPSWSGFTQYFAKNFKRLWLKKLISTCYIEGLGGKTAREIEKNSPLFNPGKSRNSGKLLVMERDANGESNGIEFRGYLKGNGDFASKEVTKLRDEADFIITNPPFSKFRKFMSWIQEGKKQFIVMGNKNAITYKEIFPLLKEDRMWLGARPLGQDAYFILPEDYKAWVVANREEGSAYRMVNGEPMGRAAICWYTNVDHWKRHQPMSFASMADNLQNNEKLRKKLLQDYGSADAYPRYDNFDAIEVPYVDAIPSDFDGAMGVPITFLDKYNPEQVEILGSFNASSLESKEADGYVPSPDPPTIVNGVEQMWNGPVVNKKPLYKRIVIRLRHPEPQNAPALPEEAVGGGAEEEDDDDSLRPGM